MFRRRNSIVLYLIIPHSILIHYSCAFLEELHRDISPPFTLHQKKNKQKSSFKTLARFLSKKWAQGAFSHKLSSAISSRSPAASHLRSFIRSSMLAAVSMEQPKYLINLPSTCYCKANKCNNYTRIPCNDVKYHPTVICKTSNCTSNITNKSNNPLVHHKLQIQSKIQKTTALPSKAFFSTF